MFLILFSGGAAAETDYVAGAATYHMLGTHQEDTQYFRNRWSKDGRLIGTSLVAVQDTSIDGSHYTTASYFAGQNSVGGAIAGAVGSTGTTMGLWRAGFLAGIYAQDASRFYVHGIYPGGLPIGNTLNIICLVGVDLVYGRAVKWHVSVTPALALTYLSFQF